MIGNIFFCLIWVTICTSSPICGTKGERRGMVSIIHDGGSHSSASSPAREDVGFWVYTIWFKCRISPVLCYQATVRQHLKPGTQPVFSVVDLQAMLTYLFGFFGLFPLLSFPLLGLISFVFTLFLFRAAVTLGLYESPGWPLWRLKVNPSIGCPVRIFTGRVTVKKKIKKKGVRGVVRRIIIQ